MIIGLTGSIGCGKSTVSNMFVALGAKLVDADLIAREVVEPGSAVLSQIAKQFGPTVIHPDGTLNRSALGEIIFNDAAQKDILNQIIHPRIREIMKARMQQLDRLNPNGLVIVDVPLLFESHLEDLFEQILVVYVPEAVQLQRLMAREGLTEVEAKRRISSQLSIEEKRNRTNLIVDNSGTMEQTNAQVALIMRNLGVEQ